MILGIGSDTGYWPDIGYQFQYQVLKVLPDIKWILGMGVGTQYCHAYPISSVLPPNLRYRKPILNITCDIGYRPPRLYDDLVALGSFP